MHRTQHSVDKFGKMEKASIGRSRRGQKNGQTPKLMDCSKPEQVSTKEHGKVVKRFQILEDGRVLAKEATNWKIEGQKKEVSREKSIRGF